jgi:hypothetical protein
MQGGISYEYLEKISVLKVQKLYKKSLKHRKEVNKS